LKGLVLIFEGIGVNFEEGKEREGKGGNGHRYQTRGVSSQHVTTSCRGRRELLNTTLKSSF